jgi:hypothetical protein
MLNQFINPLTRQLSIRARMFLILLVGLPSYSQATDVQATTCTNKQLGTTKQIHVEHVGSKSKACRTLYGSGDRQNKEIAWAQDSPQICSQVADNLISKLLKTGWDCNNTPKPKKPEIKAETKADLPIHEDDIFNSIPK